MGLMSFVTNRDLFPGRWGFAIFVAYMALFINQGLLVTASRKGNNAYPYNPTTVVLLTEILKLVLSTSAYVKDHSISQLTSEISKHRMILVYYLIPALLYCLYNNLSFVNLAYFDPTTYFMFMQIRLLMTGVIYQFLFKRKLSSVQWLSLLLVTIGCMVQKTDFSQYANFNPSFVRMRYSIDWKVISMSTGFILVMVQICCSVFAGVYNEYLIKHIAGDEVHIMVQNVYMYLDSILCNLVVLTMKGDLSSAFSGDSMASIAQAFVVAIIVNNAVLGIVTSLFLKNLNSILKAIASAVELVFTALLSYVLLSIPIYWNTVVAVAIVSYAVVLYAQNPVKPAGVGSIGVDKKHKRNRSSPTAATTAGGSKDRVIALNEQKIRIVEEKELLLEQTGQSSPAKS